MFFGPNLGCFSIEGDGWDGHPPINRVYYTHQKDSQSGMDDCFEFDHGTHIYIYIDIYIYIAIVKMMVNDEYHRLLVKSHVNSGIVMI